MKKRIAVMILALAVCLCLPVVAFAADADPITVGDFTIAATDGSTVLTEDMDYTYSNGKLTVTTTTPVTIGMKDGVTTTEHHITIDTSSGAANVTLNNITIETTDDVWPIHIEGGNLCTFDLVGLNTIKNTYAYGCAVVGSSNSLAFTSSSNGILNMSSVDSAVCIYEAGDITIGGNAKVTAQASGSSVAAIEIYSDVKTLSSVTVKDSASLTIPSGYRGIENYGPEGSAVTIQDNATVTITEMTSSGIYTNDGPVVISGIARVKISGNGKSTAGIRSEGAITISGAASLELTNTGAYGMRSYKSSIAVSDNAKVSIDTVSGTGAYAETSITLSDNVQFTVKDAENYGICGSDEGFQLSGSVKFHATNVDTGIVAGSGCGEGTTVSISDSVQIAVDGSSKSGIKYSGGKGAVFMISGKPTINVVSSGSGYGISFGKATATVSTDLDAPTINITSNGGSSDDGLHASSDGTLTIAGDTKINIFGTAEYAVNADLTVQGDAEIHAAATVERGVYGDITVAENAKVTIGKTTERGVYGDVIVRDNAEFTVSEAGEEGVYGNLTIQDKAKVTVVAVGSDKVLSKDPKVKPIEGKVYMVKAGASEANAATSYYPEEMTISKKPAWRYFHAEPTDVIPVTISGVEVADKEYDGTPVTRAGTPKAMNGTEEITGLSYTYTWYKNSVTEGNKLTEAPYAAGDYILVVAVDGGAYVGQQEIKFTIEQKEIDIPAQPDAVTYNGASQTYGVTATDAYTVTGGVQTDANEAGYDVTISLTDKANTCWANGTTTDLTHKFIINKAEVVEPTQAEAVTYNGSEQTYAVASTDDYTVTGGVQTAANEEGYIVTISLKDQDNYKWKGSDNSDNLTHKFIINKKSVTITAEDKSAYVGNKQPELTYTVSGLIGEDELTTEPTLTTNADMKLVGEYTITASGADAGSNYTITYMPGKLTVEQIPVTLYSITKAPCENGKVTVQAVMAAKGSTIKVSAVPAEGYKVVSLTVTDAAGNEIEVVDGRVTMPASDITVSAVFVYDLPYIDVADDNEHYTAIAYMYVNGLMVGTSTEEYIFDGDVTMTRAQIAQILYCLAGKPAAGYAGTFTDVAEGAWYASAVEWAAAEGIVYGVGNDKFAPDRTITTAEMAALICRYAQCKQNGECTTSDWLTESAEALTWCVDNGILTDTSAAANRYLAAEMFYNMHNLLNK